MTSFNPYITGPTQDTSLTNDFEIKNMYQPPVTAFTNNLIIGASSTGKNPIKISIKFKKKFLDLLKVLQ